MDKSLDELAAEGSKGKRSHDEDRRRQSWQGGGGWKGQGGGGGGQRGGRATQHRDGARRGYEGQQRPAAAARESYCFFGDSFVRLFGLVRHPEVHFHTPAHAVCAAGA